MDDTTTPDAPMFRRVKLKTRVDRHPGQALQRALYRYLSGGGTRTSRLPLVSAGPTRPIRSISSTMRAARL